MAELKKKKGKGCLVALVVMIGFFVLIGIFSGGGEKRKSTPTLTPAEQEKQAIESQKSPEEQIKKLVQKNLEGENNMSWPYEDKIEVIQNPNGKYSVDIKFNADDNLSKGLIKTGIQMKISEILTALFTEREDIQKATVSALFALQDKYGNPFRGDVYVAEMDAEEAKKVNWNIDSTTLALTILPKVYKTSYPYRIF